VNVHLCTARTKNWYQFRNRLKKYSQKKFFKKTDDGTQIYFSTREKEIQKILKKEDYYFDEEKKQFILNPKIVPKLIGKIRMKRLEEYPTSDRDVVESEDY
jgi:pyruvate formate-lyase activating enzyme-like uncharacterized protein